MHRIGQAGQHFQALEHRVGVVLQVLALDRQGLGTELLLGIGQVLEAVGLDLDDLFQVFGGKGDVVVGQVGRGIGVLVAAGLLHHRLVGLGRKLGGAAEHHVFKEVGEAGLAVLDLVARAGLHRNVQRHHAGAVGGHHDHAQAVVQGLHLVGLGEDPVIGGGSRLRQDGRRDQGGRGQAGGTGQLHQGISHRSTRTGKGGGRITPVPGLTGRRRGGGGPPAGALSQPAAVAGGSGRRPGAGHGAWQRRPRQPQRPVPLVGAPAERPTRPAAGLRACRPGRDNGRFSQPEPRHA